MVEEKKQEESKEKTAQKAQAEEKKAEKAPPKAEEHPRQDEKKKKEPKESDIKLSKKAQDIISSIGEMSVLELSALVKALEEKFGVTAAQPVIAAGVPGAAAPGAAAPAEEKAIFTVVLANAGSNKIQVIKQIRSITTLGLKEAKDLVESAPKTVKEGIAKEEAEDIKKKLEAAGAKIELK